MSKRAHTPASAAAGIEQALRRLEGRWKLVILFHLFGGKTVRFSGLERAIPGISQKMLTQQLRQLEGDGIVTRTVHAEVPPKVEYHLTSWGQSLCPVLDNLLTWAEQQPAAPGHPDATSASDTLLRGATAACPQATTANPVDLKWKSAKDLRRKSKMP